jgi:hypothetical protein
VGEKGLTADEQRALSVGTDSSGGYLVTPDTTGAMVKKMFETSEMRRYASVQAISTDALEGWEGELRERFWIGSGCVAGGHDDIDGDGLRDCWLAQYDGGSGMGQGTFGVNLACLGSPIQARWSYAAMRAGFSIWHDAWTMRWSTVAVSGTSSRALHTAPSRTDSSARKPASPRKRLLRSAMR